MQTLVYRRLAHLLATGVALTACSGGAPAGNAYPSSTSSASTCPTADTLVAVASAAADIGGQVAQISDIRCSADWSVAAVDILDGGMDEAGNPQSVTTVQLFRRQAGQWTLVDRSAACASGEVPDTLHAMGCEAS